MVALLLYAVVMAAQPDWGYKPSAYESEHVVYAGLVGTDGPTGENDSYIGAFIDGECRGVAQASTSNNILYFALRVKGSVADNGKQITFRHCTRSGLEFDITPMQQLVYSDNATTGTLSSLYTLNFIKPDSYQITQQSISVSVGDSVDLMQYIKFFPDGANVPKNPNWDFANNQSYYVVENNMLIGKQAVDNGYLGFFADEMKPIDDVSSFLVTVVGLKGFVVEDVITGLGDYCQLRLTPNPVNAKYTPSLLNVVIDWNSQYPNELGNWQIAEISNNDESRLNWSIVPKSLGHGIITVYYDKKEMGNAELTIGQSYQQKAGWTWSTFYESIESGTMNTLFGNAIEEIRGEDELMYNDPQYGYFGTLTMLFPDNCYKVKIAEDPGYVVFTVGANNYSADDAQKQYHTGWNWMPYASQLTLSPDEYFAPTFSDGDRIVSKDDGFAEYNNGKWVGTLTSMRFGQGYMFYNSDAEQKTVTTKGDKNFSQSTNVRNAKRTVCGKKVWTYNSAPFANNMTVIADLGNRYSTDNYSVGAFVGDECRGEGRMVDGKCFITIHAQKGENISFLLHDELTGETRSIKQNMMFTNMAGSMSSPVPMTIDETTSVNISSIEQSGIAIVGGQLSLQGIDAVSTTIVNAMGVVMLRNQTDISGLPSGVYAVIVKTKTGKTITKTFAI